MDILNVINVNSLKFNKESGLIPVIVQEVKSKEVLMAAYANKEAVEKTMASGYAHYWSRSRNKLWMKGETSGNIQKVYNILVDCDYDTLLYLITQKGNTCHKGKRTCFHNELRK